MVEEELRADVLKEKDWWSESIAVGSKEFMEKIQVELGYRSLGRSAIAVEAGSALKEPLSLYGTLFEGEKEALSYEKVQLLKRAGSCIYCPRNSKKQERIMKAEFTAIIEEAPEGGYWAICPEISGANGQGESIEEAKESLRGAIELILEDRREDIFRGLPKDVIRDKVMVA